MKIKLLVLVFLLTVGCRRSVTSGDLEYATKMCAGNGGIDYFWVAIDDKIKCKNKAEFSFGDDL